MAKYRKAGCNYIREPSLTRVRIIVQVLEGAGLMAGTLIYSESQPESELTGHQVIVTDYQNNPHGNS